MHAHAEEDKLISARINTEQQKAAEKKGEAREVSVHLGGDSAEFMETDSQGDEDMDEASSRLLQQLEPQQHPHEAADPSQQQQQQQQQGDAADNKSRQDLRHPEEDEEKTKQMEIDFQHRVSLDDVGKEGLSPEHAAG